ncbi:MAG: hypothetical protein ACREBB_05370 [Nitrosotalea sp.]
MAVKPGSQNMIEIYNYDRLLAQVFRQLKNEFSKRNFDLAQQYDRVMVNESLAKATRLKQLKMILSLTRLFKKDLNNATKSDNKLMFNNQIGFSKSSHVVLRNITHSEL